MEACASVAGKESLAFVGQLAGVRPVVLRCHLGSLCRSICVAVFPPIAVAVLVPVPIISVPVRAFGSVGSRFGEHFLVG